MLSPWLDASASMSPPQPPATPPRVLLLLAPPRTGSFHVARLLWQLGYGKPTEYFNRNPLYRSLLSRWGERPRWQRWLLRWRGDAVWVQRRWLRRLVQERWASSSLTGAPFFSSKLQPFQLPGSFGAMWPRLQRDLQTAGCLPPDQRSLLLLLRRDWPAAVASLHLSRCSASYDLGITPTFQHRPLNDLLNADALVDTAALYHRHLRWLQDACQVIQPLVLHHEDLISDQVASLMRVLEHCDPAFGAWISSRSLGDSQRQALTVQIARDSSPWSQQRREWLMRIGSLLEQLKQQGRIPLAHDEPLLGWLLSLPGDPAAAS